MEILFTADELYITEPEEIAANFNNTSIVSRIYNDNGSCLFLGDAGASEAYRLIAYYGDYLKSDMCQVAHHGVEDFPLIAYRYIQAETLWYPCDKALYNRSDRDADVRKALRESQYTKEIIIRDKSREKRFLGKIDPIANLLDMKHELRCDENGDFKVLVLSDVQFKDSALNEETKNAIKTIVDRENPDLVIFNGDNSYSIQSASDLKVYIGNMVAYIEEREIPWAHTFGNHDYENFRCPLTKEEQQAVYESFDYCISKAGEDALFGVGNYVIPVLDHEGDKIAFNIWCLDSGDYGKNGLEPENPDVTIYDNVFKGAYEPMEQNQIDWYLETSKLLEQYNGSKIPSMMAFHIPLQETFYAWYYKDELGLEWTGEKKENVSANAVNCGLFEAAKNRGDVLAIINSHDHINDFMVKYQGIRLCYTACIGTYQYHDDDMLGGRVVKFNLNQPNDVETYMSYVNERSE